MYDVIIIGGGPAGLTAAIYSLRAGRTVLVLEKSTFGGQITFSPKVENIPGFTEISGNEFADKLVDQALSQGADVEMCNVSSINLEGNIKVVVTDIGDYRSKTVIIATGAKHRLLGIPREEGFIGNGISFCAVCDGAFFKNSDVAVIGGGNSALQEALLLSEQSNHVYIVQNLPKLTGEIKLQEKIYSKSNISIITDSIVKEIMGDNDLTGIVISNNETNKNSVINISGMFIAIGLIPQNEQFSNVIKLNNYGYADSDESCKTITDGIFVAGDCRSKSIRQVTTAASDGAIAALAANEYIDSHSF